MKSTGLPSQPIFALLFLLGLCLRLIGLIFNGTVDTEPYIFNWGPLVRDVGLARAFNGEGGYGILSFALSAMMSIMADYAPRYWWAPQKLMVIGFETGVLFALSRLVPAGRRHWVLFAYWLNPWFIMHGAWLAYWDGTHTLMILSAIILLARTEDRRWSWFLVGTVFMVSAMFKPQGMFYFTIPVSMYLGLKFATDRSAPFVFFVAGVGTMLAAMGLFLWAGGGDPVAIVKSYAFVGGYMAGPCNNCIGFWHPVTKVLQFAMHQEGPTWSFALPSPYSTIVDRIAIVGVLSLVLLYSARLPRLQPILSDASLARFLRCIGALGFVLFLLGSLRHSDPAQHEVLILNRYSEPYATLLGVFLGLGILGLFLAHPLAQSATALARKIQALLGAAAALRTSGEPLPSQLLLLLVAFSSLVIPQLGTRAHENHAYGGLVLLIPLALADRRVGIAWLGMTVIHFLAQLANYQFGRAQILPTLWLDNPHAQPLLSAIRSVLPVGGMDPLLNLQSGWNSYLLRHWPQEPTVSILSLFQFILLLWVLRELFRRAAPTNTSMSGGIASSSLEAGTGSKGPHPDPSRPDPPPMFL